MKAKNSKRKQFKKRGVESKDVQLKERSIVQISLLDSLLETCDLQIEETDIISRRLNGFLSEGEAEELTNYLLDNQRDPIKGGFNYNQTDIKNKLKQLK